MRCLPVLLSVTAGSTDVISLLGLGLFSAHFSGNLVIPAALLWGWRADNTCLFLSVPIFVFVLGATGLLFAALQPRRISPLRPLLLLQLLMLGMLSCRLDGVSPRIRRRSAGRDHCRPIVRRGDGCPERPRGSFVARSPTTAVMTTNLTRLIMDVIATFVERNPVEVATAFHRAKQTWPVVVGFVVGGGLGAACFRDAGLYALGLPTGLALVAVIVSPATDGAREWCTGATGQS